MTQTIANQKRGVVKKITCADPGIGLAQQGKDVMNLEKQRQKAKSDRV